MICGYDFDNTIYDGDCTIDFYKFCLKKNKKIILFLPKQFIGFLLFKLKIKEKEYFKETFFTFLKKMDNIDLLISEFWDLHEYKIKKWYLNQKKDSDLIISASPDFLINSICDRLNINYRISSIVNKNTGKFLTKNCYSIEKVNRFKSEMKNFNLASFYSDSMSDLPMFKLADKAYLVKKNIIKEIEV